MTELAKKVLALLNTNVLDDVWDDAEFKAERIVLSIEMAGLEGRQDTPVVMEAIKEGWQVNVPTPCGGKDILYFNEGKWELFRAYRPNS